MEWLFAGFGAIAATIVGAIMLAVGVWSGIRAVKVTFWGPKASARIVRYWITRSEDKRNGQRFFHAVEHLLKVCSAV